MMGWQWHQLDHMQSFAPGSRQITTPVPHHSDFYSPDSLPAAQRTASQKAQSTEGTFRLVLNDSSVTKKC